MHDPADCDGTEVSANAFITYYLFALLNNCFRNMVSVSNYSIGTETFISLKDVQIAGLKQYFHAFRTEKYKFSIYM